MRIEQQDSLMVMIAEVIDRDSISSYVDELMHRIGQASEKQP
jgi:hypothetical protein